MAGGGSAAADARVEPTIMRAMTTKEIPSAIRTATIKELFRSNDFESPRTQHPRPFV